MNGDVAEGEQEAADHVEGDIDPVDLAVGHRGDGETGPVKAHEEGDATRFGLMRATRSAPKKVLAKKANSMMATVSNSPPNQSALV